MRLRLLKVGWKLQTSCFKQNMNNIAVVCWELPDRAFGFWSQMVTGPSFFLKFERFAPPSPKYGGPQLSQQNQKPHSKNKMPHGKTKNLTAKRQNGFGFAVGICFCREVFGFAVNAVGEP